MDSICRNVWGSCLVDVKWVLVLFHVLVLSHVLVLFYACVISSRLVIVSVGLVVADVDVYVGTWTGCG